MRTNTIIALTLPVVGCGFYGSGEVDYYDGPAPQISSLTPDTFEGTIGGGTVVVSGSGFGDDPSQVTVQIGYLNATILNITDSELTVKIPSSPVEAGAVDVAVGTSSGQAVLENGFVYTSGNLGEDELGYITITNDYYSCYGGVGVVRSDIPFCTSFAYTGMTGLEGKAEFLEWQFPRLHSAFTGDRAGFGGGYDVSWNEWTVQANPTQLNTFDLLDAYEDYRVDAGESPNGEVPYFTVENLDAKSGTFRANLGNPNITDWGFSLDPDLSVWSRNTAADLEDLWNMNQEAASSDPAGKDYDLTELKYCQVAQYENPRNYEYEPDWPVGDYFFDDGDGAVNDDQPVEIRVNVPGFGIENRDLVLPERPVIEAVDGAVSGYEEEWNLVGFETACPTAGEDGGSPLETAAVSWRWLPAEPVDTDSDVTATTYVRFTLSMFTLGWFGGEGAPIRATISVPDEHNVDEDGYSHVELPWSVLLQFPSVTYDVGVTSREDPGGGTSYSFTWGDSADTMITGYMIGVAERVTEYDVPAQSDTASGSVVVAYSSGTVGLFLFDNPLDAADACSDCIDNDGDGWIDDDDPDCSGSGSEEIGFGDSTCNDGVDNDEDGDIDSDDDDCTSGSGAESSECSDGEDNDGDGWEDEDDPGCMDGIFEDDVELGVYTCNDLLDNDGDGWIDYDDPACDDATADEDDGFAGASECNDGIDNDGHGDIDAEDTLCWLRGADYAVEAPEFKDECIDETDNDGDGFVDGNDPDCEYPSYGRENYTYYEEDAGRLVTACYNNVDDDEDGFIDADDPGCTNEGGEADGFVNDETD